MGEHRLYDLTNDPYEMRNLFGDAAHADRAHELLARLKDWQRRTGDSVKLPARF
jgi:hypothetical protein